MTTRLGEWVSGLCLNVIYLALLVLVSPILLMRVFKHGKYRTGWAQKWLGQVPQLPPLAGAGAADGASSRIWFHAVSVGEVLLLQSVIPEIKRRDPQADIVISTTTTTGQKVAQEKFPDCRHCYFPLDFTWAVRRAIERIQPTQIVLVELELWPNFILTARRYGVPLSLINGRLGERSFRGYSRLNWCGGIVRRVLQCFDVIAAQTSTYAERFQRLGAVAECVLVTGSVKYDRVQTDRRSPRVQALRKAFGISDNESVFVAGSTQDPEEQIAINVWSEVRREFPNLRLIIVPRHKERFDEVARLITDQGHVLIRRSQTPTAPDSPSDAVLLLDTLGELADCWGIADFAFVGGSLTNRGGQNMIEPSGFGAAVCFGPNTRNFRDIVENLIERQAATVVADETELVATLRIWLQQPNIAIELGQRAQAFVLSQSGATHRTVDLLLSPESEYQYRAA